MADQFRFLIRSLGNAAFVDEDRHVEIARLLHEAAERVESGETGGNLLDFNGNTVGDFGIKRDDDNPLP